MEYRPYYLGREWVRLGHRVRILAANRSHIRAHQPYLKGQNRIDEIIDGIQYTWFATPSYQGNGVGRTINMTAFILRLHLESRKIAYSFKPNVVIASSTYPMDIFPARRIAKFTNAKLVFEVHDLWPLSPMELGGMSKWHPFIMLVQASEDYSYRHADVVVSMLPKVREYMESRGMKPHKLHIVPNGVDLDEWSNRVDLSLAVVQKLAKLKEEGKKIIGYAGTHGLANALNNLLDTAKFMRDEKVAFVLVGGGPEKLSLEQRVEREGICNVYFFDPVKKEQIPALLQWFDVAYIGCQKVPIYRFGIAPNKLMDYMMAGCPILNAVESGNDPVGEAGCGLSITPDDPQAVVEGIHDLLSLSERERRAMGQRGRVFVLQNHTYPVLAQKFLSIMGGGQ
jgi:glycosyltransferase involved in cell wall biosynthesis